MSLTKQILFQTDLGYAATKEKLLSKRKSPSRPDGTVLLDPESDYRGRLVFHLKNYKDVPFQMTTKGKLSITYPEASKYSFFLELVKPYLVTAEGLPVTQFTILSRPNEKKEPPSQPRATVHYNPEKLILGLEALLAEDISMWLEDRPESIWSDKVLTKGVTFKSFAEKYLRVGYPGIYRKLMAHRRLNKRLMRERETEKIPKSVYDYVVRGIEHVGSDFSEGERRIATEIMKEKSYSYEKLFREIRSLESEIRILGS